MTVPEQPSSELLPTAPLGLDPLYKRIHAILTAAHMNVMRTVNTEMARAYWLIGREIVEEEQAGQGGLRRRRDRADFGPLAVRFRQGLHND